MTEISVSTTSMRNVTEAKSGFVASESATV